MSSVVDPDLLTPRRPSKKGEPAWDVAWLFPLQGDWTEADYLALPTNRLIELSDGNLEVLPMPTPFHQCIVKFLFQLLDALVVATRLGEVFFAPLPIRLWPGKMREPDVLFVSPGRVLMSKPPQKEPTLP